MSSLKRIELDVLKPHHPNSLDFSSMIAEKLPGARIELTVTEVDEKTETVVIVIAGENLQYETIVEAISNMGGSIHSIDRVEVESESELLKPVNSEEHV
ncbi:MAG: DUF211 domain-containing protein [Thermodesulfobacteriota bacterium]|nr:DUF211 domain-containing protein [Thermodesulfobacteriota bacterium]